MQVLDRIPVPATDLPEDLLDYLWRDKKSRGGAITAVLLEDVGRYALKTLDRPEELVDALRALLSAKY
jgi:3-dehydroquinate synthetase